MNVCDHQEKRKSSLKFWTWFTQGGFQINIERWLDSVVPGEHKSFLTSGVLNIKMCSFNWKDVGGGLVRPNIMISNSSMHIFAEPGILCRCMKFLYGYKFKSSELWISRSCTTVKLIFGRWESLQTLVFWSSTSLSVWNLLLFSFVWFQYAFSYVSLIRPISTDWVELGTSLYTHGWGENWCMWM